MKQRMALLVVFVFPVVAWLSACGGSGGGGITPPPPDPPTVTVSASPTTITLGQSTTITWSSANASSCTASGSWSGSLATSGSQTVTPAATGTLTYTVSCTGPGGSAKASATLTVNQRVITLSLSPSTNLPNGEIYSDFGGSAVLYFTCTGCVSGDTPYIQSTFGNPGPFSSTTLGVVLLFIGPGYVPGPISAWVTGVDGAKSNTLWFTFDGSQNVAAQDPSSGEIYYAYSGNGTSGSFSVLKFKQDGTGDGNFQDGGFGIAADNLTHDIVTTGLNIGVEDANGNPLTGTNPSSANFLAVSASGGLGCAAQPTIDSVSCLNLPKSVADNPQPFTLPGLPSGSQPTPIKVLDASHVVLYGRGDQTLRWYTISGTTATATGMLQLPEFTATDANYWKTYPVTGGWDLVQIGSTLGVMGQVVNSDGTVSQKLALVNNTNQTLIQSVDLPAGTVHIAADPTNNAVVAEYVDFSGSTPILRFERVYVDTGNETLLESTSTLVPGAGFLVTQDGSHIAVFVEGKTDFELNQ